MPIVPSRSGEIDGLIRRLRASSAVDREVAVARLRLLGGAVVPALLRELSGGTTDSIVAALAVAEAIDDRRLSRAILPLISHADPRVAVRATESCAALTGPEVCRALADAVRGDRLELSLAAVASLAQRWRQGSTEALDALLEIVFDQTRAADVRRQALAATENLPPSERRAIDRRLAAMGDAPLAPLARQESARGARGGHPREPGGTATRSLSERLRELLASGDGAGLASALADGGPDAVEAALAVLPETESPAAVGILAAAIERHPSPQAIPVLDRTLRRLSRLPEAHRDPTVAEARARVHLALASAGSRIGLYDLRDLLGARPILTAGSLVRAASAIGDVSLLPRLAALAHDEPAHEAACGEAVTRIVRRDRLRRSAKALRALRPEHAAALDRLWPREKKGRGAKRAEG